MGPDVDEEQRQALMLEYAANYMCLETKNKLKYIRKCIKNAEKFEQEAEEYMRSHPGYSIPSKARIRSLLEAPELALWESANGRPEKPSSSAQEVAKADLIRKGEFKPDDYEDEKAANEAFVKLWKSLGYLQHKGYEKVKTQEEMEYCVKLKEYYENAPAILKPMIKATMPPKLRSEVLGDDASAPSPRKRKAAKSVEAITGEEVDTSPKKSKKHKKDRNEESEIAQEVVEDVASVSKASSHKKKKKSKDKSEH